MLLQIFTRNKSGKDADTHKSNCLMLGAAGAQPVVPCGGNQLFPILSLSVQLFLMIAHYSSTC